MIEATPLPFDLPAVARKKLTVDFDGGNQSSDGGVLALRAAEQKVGIIARLASALPDRRDPTRVRHRLVEIIGARVFAICCGWEDGIDHDHLRDDPALKMAVGRAPETGAALASQSTISRFENAPSRTDAARLACALVDQLTSRLAPCRRNILDIDDTFDAAHGGQQLTFWNAHHDERGFATMHVYDTARGLPVVAILRPAKTPRGTEVRTVVGKIGSPKLHVIDPTSLPYHNVEVLQHALAVVSSPTSMLAEFAAMGGVPIALTLPETGYYHGKIIEDLFRPFSISVSAVDEIARPIGRIVRDRGEVRLAAHHATQAHLQHRDLPIVAAGLVDVRDFANVGAFGDHPSDPGSRSIGVLPWRWTIS